MFSFLFIELKNVLNHSLLRTLKVKCSNYVDELEQFNKAYKKHTTNR
jgi:hypothetical protein